jgi:hypothetical protein
MSEDVVHQLTGSGPAGRTIRCQAAVVKVTRSSAWPNDTTCPDCLKGSTMPPLSRPVVVCSASSDQDES